MVDSIDSGTDHVGQSFKATLESPITVDNDTVFPKGAEAYVKLTKVESAGRLSGRSELQLQLDRIFLGKTSYQLETSTYTKAANGTIDSTTLNTHFSHGVYSGIIDKHVFAMTDRDEMVKECHVALHKSRTHARYVPNFVYNELYAYIVKYVYR